MDKSAIRNFAIEARKMLMKSAETEAGFYGVTKNGCKSPIQKGNDFEVYETIAGTENRIYGADIKRRENLVRAVETLGFEQVMEETAYTWFNRIIAIRFMEVNDYLPARVRVLSSEIGSNTPDIVTQFLDIDLNMTPEELEKVQKAKDENRYDDAFRILFIKQCNELNAILPGLFEKTDDYMELLLKLSYTSDGVVRMLIDSINENNFNVDTEGQVEIIGWMYQYYNTELKDDTFAKLKKNVKITKERIPAATQLFTPDWIVRYMVENSVGRVWIDHLRAVDSSIDEKEKAEEFGWKYYLPEAEQEDSVAEKLVETRKDYAQLEPKDITCIDPCMGSGHILVYMFDALMDIYRSEGFSERDAVFSILENNIRGLDIDKRAYQLSYFALMMKAREYNRTFFRGKQDEEGNRCFVEPLVISIDESNSVNRSQLKYFGANLDENEKNNALNQINGLLDEMVDIKEYGSILNITHYDWKLLCSFVNEYNIDRQILFDTLGIDETKTILIKLVKQGKLMADKYWVVSTNPPYMSNKGMGTKLLQYVQNSYFDEKMDLFAVMMHRCEMFTQKSGVFSMITQHSWMFLSAYEKMRKKFQEKNLINMIHLGTRTFEEISGEVVQSTSFVFRKLELRDYLSIYMRLVNEDSAEKKEKKLLDNNEDVIYITSRDKYRIIPTMPEIYWFSNHMYEIFNGESLEKYTISDGQNVTGDNNKFVRMHWEVEKSKISSKGKWKLYAKGGSYRKWYGNLWEVVNWSKEAIDFYHHNSSSRVIPEYLWEKSGITWSLITTNNPSFRFLPKGCTFDKGGSSVFMTDESRLLYILGILNSNLFLYIVNSLNPTLNVQVKDVRSLPIRFGDEEEINKIVQRLVELEKNDWDAYETSYEYVQDPVVAIRKEGGNLKKLFKERMEYIQECRIEALTLETELNRRIVAIYELSDELNIEINENSISILGKTERELLTNLISYFVGCMFGRYHLDVLSDINLYDSNNVIPISENEYFADDIVAKFEKFILKVFGKEYHEENMSFISEVLGNKDESSKKTLRKYFCNEFYKDHCNLFSTNAAGKRPIYWLFDSGKQNGFKCLIYMHRYNKDTLNLIRSEYLHKTQDAVENALKNAEYIIQTSASVVERAKATKDRDRYVKQLNEMRIYYQALSHLALQKIEIELDDGVKHNYQLFQNIEVIVDGGKKQKVDLLAKI